MRSAAIISLLVGVVLLLGCSFANAQSSNRLMSISHDAGSVTLKTETPVGYSYTVYDSFDPVRVVIDFPGMDVSQIQETTQLNDQNLQQVRVSEFDLESGKLGRVEILLGKATNYDVSLNGTDFEIKFTAANEPVSTIGESLVKTPAKPKVEAATVSPTENVSEDVKPVTKPAARHEVVNLPSVNQVSFEGAKGQQARFVAPEMERFQYFRLAGPPRLVVDIYGVKPAFKQRSFPVEDGFSLIRVGVYKDKTRFVFDAENEAIPGFEVGRAGDAVLVDWSGQALPVSKAGNEPAAVNVPVKKEPVAKKSAPVAIEALDFDSKEGVSTFTVTMSGQGGLIESEQSGDIVRFGVANATISRSLRRVVDASSFPSAVKLITPYTVQNKGVQDVRFAAELKGPVSYKVSQDENRIIFTTTDGAFAEFKPPQHESIGVVVEPKKEESATPSEVMASTISALDDTPAKEEPAETSQLPAGAPTTITIAGAEKVYTGEKISLIFDDADIRQILQLIGDVSNLNIIASDEVKGSITLRLTDVPWDQALDLIMDIKDLGMLKQGNIARILPRNRIRAMEEAMLAAKRTKEKLEDLITEVIMVSHTDLENVAKPATELLSDRGKITEDSRNKQIIVTDIPTAIRDIRQLVKILDTPEKQVLIESRIVEASSNFSRDLGVKWGFTYDNQVGGRPGESFANLDKGDIGLGGSFILPPSSVAGGAFSGMGADFTFGRLGIDSTVLDLKISALETSGHGKVVSQPRVATLNGEPAMIAQGTKIPYQSVSDEGTETKFENAELKLEVTPVINPDDSVILEIVASNSSVGATVPTGVGDAIAIDEKKAETKVLVQDGETTVIGGIFVEDIRSSETGVPFLMDLPYLGRLFKSVSKTQERRELLIFVTPRILN